MKCILLTPNYIKIFSVPNYTKEKETQQKIVLEYPPLNVNIPKNAHVLHQHPHNDTMMTDEKIVNVIDVMIDHLPHKELPENQHNLEVEVPAPKMKVVQHHQDQDLAEIIVEHVTIAMKYHWFILNLLT